MTAAETARTAGATTDLALVAALAALIAVCSILPAVNVSTFAPITLQTFGVLLAGALLGARRGALAVALWILVGVIGLPVFANGRAGLPVLVGPTGGYILGFVAGAAIIGLAARLAVRRGGRLTPWALAAGGVVALLVVHAAGIVGLHLRADLGWQAAATVDAAFWIGDVVKLAATVLVAGAVHRAFPELLRRAA